MRPIYIEKYILVLEQVVLTVRAVLMLGGLYCCASGTMYTDLYKLFTNLDARLISEHSQQSLLNCLKNLVMKLDIYIPICVVTTSRMFLMLRCWDIAPSLFNFLRFIN